MHLSFYSCLMAMIASSTMIVVVYFLKKTKYFANVFGVGFMAMLYFLSLVRMLFPIEFPAIQTVVKDKLILPKLMDVLENRSTITCHLEHKALYIFGSASAVVTIVLIAVFLFKQLRFINHVLKMPNYATEHEREMLRSIADKVFGRKTRMRLVKSDDVSVPMVVGMLRSTVAVPNITYTDKALKAILYHECTHLKNYDLWFKFLVHIYCCVFWFNPFVYLLKKDIDFILEIKCDNAVCRRLSEEGRLDYAKVVNDSVRNSLKKRLPVAVMSAGFAMMNSIKRHAYRMNNLLNPVKTSHRTSVVIVSLLMVCICLLSYCFVLQPDYSKDISVAMSSVAGSTSSTSGYLVPDDNGDYRLFIDEQEFFVPKEDVKNGRYNDFEIIYK